MKILRFSVYDVVQKIKKRFQCVDRFIIITSISGSNDVFVSII